MRLLSTVLVLCCTSVLVLSCQKELSFENGDPNPSGPNDPGGPGGGGNHSTENIAGDYEFAGVQAWVSTSVTVTAGGQTMRTVTTSEYQTTNNAGTAQITASDIVTDGISLSINTDATVETYINDVLQDQMSTPFSYNLTPQSQNTATYTRVSADSILVSTNLTGPIPGIGGGGPIPVPPGPYGHKLSWSGDTLLLKTTTTVTENFDQGGTPATMVASVTAITKLRKR